MTPPGLIDIKKVVVVGAGTMGSGIAAQLANAGVDVWLLDIVPEGAEDRDVIAKGAIQRMLKASPATDPLNAGFMLPENAKRITPGNTQDHLEQAVAEADWVVEVVLENMEVKAELFEKLDRLKKPDAIISSNTSTIPLADMVEGRSESFRKNFVITHFFNPVRFMHLLEIVESPETKRVVVDTMRWFGDYRMGKNVIMCKDTPAFLANRIGIYFMFRAITASIEHDMKIEEVDAVLGSPIGFPKEGIFGLLDLVGVGIIPLVTHSLLKTLPDDDLFRKFEHEKGLSLVDGLLKQGCFGRKSPKGGFYRMTKLENGKKQKEAVNLLTGDYYTVEKPKNEGLKAAKKYGPRTVFQCAGELGEWAWPVVRDTLLYACWLVPEIVDDIVDLDAALRGGYNARWGPFQLIDQLGVEWFTQRVLEDGMELPPLLKMAGNRQFYMEQGSKEMRMAFDFEKQLATYQEFPQKEGVLRFSDVTRNTKPLVEHYSAALWDLGDGVTCFSFKSKMNTLDPSVLLALNDSIIFMTENASQYKAMVLYNSGTNFSLGANLALVQAGLGTPFEPVVIDQVSTMIWQGQSVFKALREAPFPVVGAPHGMALGGGCEILLHCDALRASAETYTGLVESGVGLIPAWGGCLRYLERAQQAEAIKAGPVPPARQAFQTILMPQMAVSTSAFDAVQKLWLRPADTMSMNPDRVLFEAKMIAQGLVDRYTAPDPAIFKLPGPPAKAALSMAIDDFYTKGDATWHDVVVADALATVITGGDTNAGKLLSDSDVAHLERASFMALLATPQTRKRIAHTLKTGKPLRENPTQSDQSVTELRAALKPVNLSYKPLSNGPLTGGDALQLRIMAEITAMILKYAAK